MKVEPKRESTRLAQQALRRATRKVLSEAVSRNETIPIWDGERVVWKVPREELAELDADERAQQK